MALEKQQSSELGSEASLAVEDEPLLPLPDPDVVEAEEQKGAAVEVRNTEATARTTSKQISRGRSGSRDSRVRKEHNVKRESVAKHTHSEDNTLIKVNEFFIDGVLGKGSFSTVYQGRTKRWFHADKLFALKQMNKRALKKKRNITMNIDTGERQISSELDKVYVEIALMEQLVHPHCVELLSAIDDDDNGLLYLVMEHVDGAAIMEVAPSRADGRHSYYSPVTGGVLTEMTIVAAMHDVISGLEYLHEYHMCHRDLKPQNILINSEGTCKIADFGTAHFFEQEDSMEYRDLHALARSHSRGQLKQTEGTHAFWAPEMMVSDKSTFSGYSQDRWAVGVCAWVFAFGTIPFDGEEDDEIWDKVKNEQPEFPGEIDPGLKELIEGFLVKDPDERLSLPDAQENCWLAKHLNTVRPTNQWPDGFEVPQEDLDLFDLGKASQASIDACVKVGKSTFDIMRKGAELAKKGADMTVVATVKGAQFAADGTVLVANKTVEAGQRTVQFAADGTKLVANTTVKGAQFAADGTILVANKTVEAGQRTAQLATDGTMLVADMTKQGAQATINAGKTAVDSTFQAGQAAVDAGRRRSSSQSEKSESTPQKPIKSCCSVM
mmetsp:Transcript_37150/g.100381  ORF Transcript_37150/g.100381 Transcript_37150/m.100381 type:complete len:608 (+) Transcript_37150:83-1906(+)|eukprot:CAMPEP_0119469980 /NCGR_PEP_ID=MMETSP1344-20130328/3069_1 /TAXON_ID=236787 /ORGANISM="Florenciella parvula, Strain CCMP2471" /LENGTH=607 /DNA_ID=CAMNT_0007502595 /DNA_START=60 /DNA_END=1883 /DNA_ORIENTATION=+